MVNEKRIVITEDNYPKLFSSSKRFEKYNGIDNNKLIEKYPYVRDAGKQLK